MLDNLKFVKIICTEVRMLSFYDDNREGNAT